MNNVNTLKRVLQKEQLRYTPQRQAVWDELCSSNNHRDAEDIYFALRSQGISVSRATVYRTVEVLVRHNMARRIDLGEGRSRYEHKLDPTHHDHLICTKCGKIVEFTDKNLEELQQKIATEYDFKLTQHIHQLFGTCSSCQKS